MAHLLNLLIFHLDSFKSSCISMVKQRYSRLEAGQRCGSVAPLQTSERMRRVCRGDQLHARAAEALARGAFLQGIAKETPCEATNGCSDDVSCILCGSFYSAIWL